MCLIPVLEPRQVVEGPRRDLLRDDLGTARELLAVRWRVPQPGALVEVQPAPEDAIREEPVPIATYLAAHQCDPLFNVAGADGVSRQWPRRWPPARTRTRTIRSCLPAGA